MHRTLSEYHARGRRALSSAVSAVSARVAKLPFSGAGHFGLAVGLTLIAVAVELAILAHARTEAEASQRADLEAIPRAARLSQLFSAYGMRVANDPRVKSRILNRLAQEADLPGSVWATSSPDWILIYPYRPGSDPDESDPLLMVADPALAISTDAHPERSTWQNLGHGWQSIQALLDSIAKRPAASAKRSERASFRGLGSDPREIRY